jgi:carbonyl reductase 1
MGRDSFNVQAQEKWWTPETVAVVTGANKGIGKAIAQIFAEQGLKTVVAARNEALGREATEDIKSATGSDNVIFASLDISDPSSVAAFGDRIKKEFGSVHVFVNNAGIAYKGNAFGAEEAQTTLATNFAGTRAVCERIAPLMPEGGRIVNVCSMAGKVRILKSRQLLQRFQAVESPEDVAALADKFVADIKSGSYQKEGWPASMYGVSKLCEAAYTRTLAAQLRPKGIDVTACCPGYVNTDMSSHRGTKTPAQGADTPAWLALLAPKGTTAKFFSERKEEPF